MILDSIKLGIFFLIFLGVPRAALSEEKKPIFNGDGSLLENMCHTNNYAAFLWGEGGYVPYKYQLAVIQWTPQGEFKQPKVVQIEDKYNEPIYFSLARGIRCKTDRIEILFLGDRKSQNFSLLPSEISNSSVALPVELTQIQFNAPPPPPPYDGVNIADEEGAKKDREQIPPEFRGDPIVDLEYGIGRHVVALASNPQLGTIQLHVNVEENADRNHFHDDYLVEVLLRRSTKNVEESNTVSIANGGWMEPSD